MREVKFCPWCGGDLSNQEIDRQVRKVCASAGCGYVYWDNPTPVVAGIVELDGEVILVRNVGWPEDWFGVVAGFLEKNETPEEAVLREVQEELGLDGEIVDIIGYYTFTQKNQLILAFHIMAQGVIHLGTEIEEFKAVAPEDLRPWKIGTGPAVKDWLSKRF